MTEEQIIKAAKGAFPHWGEDDLRVAFIRGAKYAIKKLKANKQNGKCI